MTLSTITLKVTDAQNDAIQGAKVKATLVGGDGWKLNSTANPTFVGTTGSDGTVSFTDLKVTPDTGAVAQTATIKFEVVDATDNTTVLKNTDDVELKAETKSLLLVTTGTGQSHEGTITDQSKLELNTTKTTFTTDDTVLLPIAEIKGVNGSVPAESATFTGKVLFAPETTADAEKAGYKICWVGKSASDDEPSAEAILEENIATWSSKQNCLQRKTQKRKAEAVAIFISLQPLFAVSAAFLCQCHETGQLFCSVVFSAFSLYLMIRRFARRKGSGQ